MRKTVGFFSGKGGTGKTTCSINTALAIHQFGEKVILLDCDLNNANLALHLGFHDFPVTLHDILEQDLNILESVHIHSSGLRFIPASLSLRQLGTDVSKLKHSLGDLDYLTILDCPSGVDENILSLIDVCDEIIVVTNPNIPAVTDAIKIIQKAIDMDKNEISVIVNMATKKHELTVEEIEEACKVPVLGTIPVHSDFKKSLHHTVPILLASPNSSASITFKRIASSMIGKEYRPPRMAWAKRFFGGF